MNEYVKYLDVAPEVKKAVENGQPVVALESTIISHGMPYPQNVETALKSKKSSEKTARFPRRLPLSAGG